MPDQSPHRKSPLALLSGFTCLRSLTDTMPPAYTELVLPADAPFELRPSPGKGWGAFATKAIPAGKIILDEEALFFITGKPPGDITAQDLTRAFDRLTKHQHQQLHLLRLDGDPKKSVANGSATWDEVLAQTNFTFDGPFGLVRGTGFHLIAARFNHACKPNMDHDMPDRRVRFRAKEAIAAGTELTFKYKDAPGVMGMDIDLTELTRAQRNRILDFECRCDLCAAGPGENENLPAGTPDYLSFSKLYERLYGNRR